MSVTLSSGSDSPRGAVKPAHVGHLYVDTAHGALYIATGATKADWGSVGGESDANLPGVLANKGQVLVTADGSASSLEYGNPPNSLRVPGGVGAYGTIPPDARPATPTDLTGVVAVLRSLGFCV